MQKRLFLILMLSVLFLLPTHAVLKERNIEGTLAMLRIELTEQHHRLERQSSLMKKQRMEVMTDLITAMNRSQQNAMMLYSQKNGYVFDLTYACHEATEQYHNFKTNVAPFRTYVQNADGEIARFDSLINDLSSMYIQALPEKSKIDRNVCLTLAVNIRRTLNYNRQQMHQTVWRHPGFHLHQRQRRLSEDTHEPQPRSEGDHRDRHRQIPTAKEIHV